MDTILRRVVIAGVVTLSLAACERKQPETGKASPPGPRGTDGAYAAQLVLLGR